MRHISFPIMLSGHTDSRQIDRSTRYLGIGGNLSHEFIILADTGESEVFCDRGFLERDVLGGDIDYENTHQVDEAVEHFTKLNATTDEKHADAAFHQQVPEERRYEGRGIEVGHIFYFGTKYSEPLNARVATPEGGETAVHMGSYGIGVSRLVGAIIEASHDEAGIIWPESVAPFDLGLINLKPGDPDCDRVGEDIYGRLQAQGLDVLYDETDERAGAKFAEMDLIGLPWQLIVGPRGAKAGIVELKNRATGHRDELTIEAAINKLAAGRG